MFVLSSVELKLIFWSIKFLLVLKMLKTTKLIFCRN